MIKNVCTYFFLLFSLFILTSKTYANKGEAAPIITGTMILEDVDSDMPYDHLDYLADQQPEPSDQSLMPSWIKTMCGPLYVALIIHLAQAQDYLTKKWNCFKRALPL